MVPIGLLNTMFSTALGATQLAKGNDIEVNRPRYKTFLPEQEYMVEQMLRNLASDPNLPGQSLMEDKIGATSANKINDITGAAQSGSEALSAISAMQGNETDALARLGIAGANNAQNNYMNLANQLSKIAGIRSAGYEKEFEYNQQQPFLDAADKRSSMLDAGTKNLFSGMGEIDDIVKKLAFSGEQSPLQVLQGMFQKNNSNQGEFLNEELKRIFKTATGNNSGTDNTSFGQQAPINYAGFPAAWG